MQRVPVARRSWVFRLVVTAAVIAYNAWWISARGDVDGNPGGILFAAATILAAAIWLLSSRPATDEEACDHAREVAKRNAALREEREREKRELHESIYGDPEVIAAGERIAQRKLEKARRRSAETVRRAERLKAKHEAAERMRRETGAGPEYRGPRCPRCGSAEFTVLGNTGSPLSPGKALIGGVVAGPTGFAAGALMGKRGKYEALCSKCGKRFTFK